MNQKRIYQGGLHAVEKKSDTDSKVFDDPKILYKACLMKGNKDILKNIYG